MENKIVLSKEEMKHIDEILKLTVKEICEKYGYDRDNNAISHSTIFPNGVEACINLFLVEEDDWNPITDITLYKNGKELTHSTSTDSHYKGTWWIEYDRIEYIVNVLVGE